MQISATTQGTVDQGGSICGEKMEIIAKVQTRSISLKLAAVRVRWNGGLLPRRYCWGSHEKVSSPVKCTRLVKNYANYGQTT
ncbi:unnamed protein product [Penicillium roqueforti FM164]|uniref:Genomic scaffold, ProqFM164S02 n=1 Tax=Penicillium roqueforti (strain FM164) TaxID=1365484 RepID=W6Q976_PENRF|nr:unnamed protein product [Penicillium roqueforti FM164]